MDFGLNEEQEELRRVVRSFLRARAPVAFARAVAEGASAGEGRVWSELAELGWLGLGVPESFGGAGLGQLEIVLVLEQMGRVVFPCPFLSHVSLALPAILEAASEEQACGLLQPLTRGSRRAALALFEPEAVWPLADVATRVQPSADGWSLRGRKSFVLDASTADMFVVAATLGDTVRLFVVPSDAAGVSCERMVTVDATRDFCEVRFDDVYVDKDGLLGGANGNVPDFQRVIDRGKLALAAELCGLADAALDMSVEYAKIRKQFDRPIGSFQAIQHKLADMKVAVENTRSLVYYAAWALDQGCPEEARVAVAMAKGYASDACPRVIADAIQVHGGVGFTWEHDLHLYFKRAKADEVLFGDAAVERELVARHLRG